MKIIKLLFACTLVKSRSIFPKPRPTTLGFHPDQPHILIPVPLFPIQPVITEITNGTFDNVEKSLENDPAPTTTLEFTTENMTTTMPTLAKDLTTTTSTGAPVYTTVFEELADPLTATLPSNWETLTSTTVIPVSFDIPETTSLPIPPQSMPENDDDKDVRLRDGFIAAWDIAKELGSMIIGGVGGMFSKITSLFN